MAKNLDPETPRAADPGNGAAAAPIHVARVEERVRDSLIRKVRKLVARHPREALSVVRAWMSREP